MSNIDIFLLSRPAEYQDGSFLTNKISIYKDYSNITGSHPQLYILPHLWSGVVPR